MFKEHFGYMIEVYALKHGIFFEEHLGCLGTWFDAYHGDFEHMIWRIFLEILA
jgi:hypothetical protein